MLIFSPLRKVVFTAEAQRRKVLSFTTERRRREILVETGISVFPASLIGATGVRA